MSRWLKLFVLLPLLLAGCGDDKTGPGKVHIGRDMCERCRMVISDVKFVSQVRGGPLMHHMNFDDIGDAVTWLNKQPWAAKPETEIWVMDYESGTDWLPARNAHYVEGYMSPMAYGYAAFKEKKENSVDFRTMVERVLKEKVMINCDPLDLEEHAEAEVKNKIGIN
ncbi:hypothetical protein RYZ26_15780 [Terasakiella sp. A23]|uniref:nitrous oxide reductase accessory protein NosL n=1 Tax=Terasakiella sp. FCG-A23 TaxID=3080561 RepID=UPI002952A8A1|nr:hypothetical protein [Terasakiella sp. A23]MDV7341067.1 hypothetical protein [Terasakiella sp. A23]